MMLKHDIRTLFLHKRAELPKKVKDELNRKIASTFLDQLHESHKTIHIYLPILSKNEIDTWPLIRQLWELEKNVVVPIMHCSENKLTNCLLSKNTALSDNKWSVPEPVHRKAIENEKIDVVVLPLLAYDKSGYRVGYGKGYYDKFLTNLSSDVLKIGLSYFPPIDKISDMKSWDIPVDLCITPQKIYQF